MARSSRPLRRLLEGVLATCLLSVGLLLVPACTSRPTRMTVVLAPTVPRKARVPTITEFPIKTANSGPFDLAAGPDGAVYFTEQVAGQIGRIAPDGTIAEFRVPQLFSSPSSITAGGAFAGGLWFTDPQTNTIWRFTPATRQFEPFHIPTADSGPDDITAGLDGAVYFTEQPTGQSVGTIVRVRPDGSFTDFDLPPPQFHSIDPNTGRLPDRITLGFDGNLWFTLDYGLFDAVVHNFGRMTMTGAFLPVYPIPADHLPFAPYDITAGPDGNVWFTEYWGSQIGVITPQGVITMFPAPQDAGPWGITAGPDGALWITAPDTPQIGRLFPDGSIDMFPIKTANSLPTAITVGSDGALYFIDVGTNQIGRITFELPAHR